MERLEFKGSPALYRMLVRRSERNHSGPLQLYSDLLPGGSSSYLLVGSEGQGLISFEIAVSGIRHDWAMPQYD